VDRHNSIAIYAQLLKSKKKGLWLGGLPPLGYDVKDSSLVVNEAEAETVRMIFADISISIQFAN
jgi:DNA invertase Pin-like site-specific DNA recombinase